MDEIDAFTLIHVSIDLLKVDGAYHIKLDEKNVENSDLAQLKVIIQINK